MNRLPTSLALIAFWIPALCACSQEAAAPDDVASSSDLTTAVRAPHIADFVEGPDGALLVDDGAQASAVNPTTGSLVPVGTPHSSIARDYPAKDGVIFRIELQKSVTRINADGSVTAIYTSPHDHGRSFPNVRFTGFDANYFYFEDIAAEGGGTTFRRVGFGPTDKLKNVGTVTSSHTYVRVATVGNGGVYWTIPRTPEKADVRIGFTGDVIAGSSLDPFEYPAGTYMHPKALAVYKGDLYALGSSNGTRGIFKASKGQSGELTGRFDRICPLPNGYRVELDDGLTEVPTRRSQAFVVNEKGAYFPIVDVKINNVDVEQTSAVARVAWDCTAQTVTDFGIATTFAWSWTQVPQIAVRGDTIFWSYRLDGSSPPPPAPFELRQTKQ